MAPRLPTPSAKASESCVSSYDQDEDLLDLLDSYVSSTNRLNSDELPSLDRDPRFTPDLNSASLSQYYTYPSPPASPATKIEHSVQIPIQHPSLPSHSFHSWTNSDPQQQQEHISNAHLQRPREQQQERQHRYFDQPNHVPSRRPSQNSRSQSSTPTRSLSQSRSKSVGALNSVGMQRSRTLTGTGSVGAGRFGQNTSTVMLSTLSSTSHWDNESRGSRGSAEFPARQSSISFTALQSEEKGFRWGSKPLAGNGVRSVNFDYEAQIRAAVTAQR
ncbi:hypothetical protein BDR26DRAFT_1002555 [Obelidium mucronatum]|nr:hypothetical protein BDR26DRAFT_1002555 [Obelidium mucronatum]